MTDTVYTFARLKEIAAASKRFIVDKMVDDIKKDFLTEFNSWLKNDEDSVYESEIKSTFKDVDALYTALRVFFPDIEITLSADGKTIDVMINPWGMKEPTRQ